MNNEDRRRYNIVLTNKGKNVVNKLPPIIQSNRKASLKGIIKKELDQLETILKKNQIKLQKQLIIL